MLANYLSQDKLERFLQIVIWIGLGVILFTVLLVSNKFLRPFVYTKAVVFRIAVEIIFFAFLWLANGV